MFENFGTDEITAILTILYIVARLIARFTPTDADDKYLDKNLPRWQWWLASITGLDLRAGRNKYGPK